jgi:hypothetical protein
MSYSCSRHQWYSPQEPCGSCTRERDMQMGMAQLSNQAAMRANMQAQRWPQDVFERLEGERDVAVKMAATYRVALEKIAKGVPGCDAEYLAQQALGSPSGSEGER